MYGRIARGRSVEASDFADITDVPVLSITPGNDGWFKVEFDGDVSTDVKRKVRRRMSSITPTEEGIRESVRAYGVAMGQWPNMPNNPSINNLKWRVEELINQVRNLTHLIQLLDVDVEASEEPLPEPMPDPEPETDPETDPS